jgi:hypothetical protein
MYGRATSDLETSIRVLRHIDMHKDTSYALGILAFFAAD